MSIKSQSEIASNGIYNLIDDDTKVRKSRKNEYFIPYASRYSGGFALLDTMKIPRPCAYKSLNLTGVEYYRGQNTLDYKISNNENESLGETLLDGNTNLIFQNGTDTTGFATFNRAKYSVGIQTDDEKAVGTHRTIIRNCDGLNRLLELNLYIKVLSNTHPDFTTEMKTTFTLKVNETLRYKLPPIKDSDGNDEPEVYIKTMEAQEDQYPKFLKFDNSTRTLIFHPKDKFDQGKIFYFTVILKEKNSDTIFYPYYCTVKILGNPLKYRTEPEPRKNTNTTKEGMDKPDQCYKKQLFENCEFAKEKAQEQLDIMEMGEDYEKRVNDAYKSCMDIAESSVAECKRLTKFQEYCNDVKNDGVVKDGINTMARWVGMSCSSRGSGASAILMTVSVSIMAAILI